MDGLKIKRKQKKAKESIWFLMLFPKSICKQMKAKQSKKTLYLNLYLNLYLYLIVVVVIPDWRPATNLRRRLSFPKWINAGSR